MSRDLDLEGDSPHSSIHLGNIDIDEINNGISLKRQTRALTQKCISHKSESVGYSLFFLLFNHPLMNL